MVLVRRRFLLAALPFVASLAGCGGDKSGGPHYPADQSRKITIHQGIWGQVWFWSGNFQPGTPSGTVTAVKRTVYIYPPTNIDQLTLVSGQNAYFYNAPPSTLVASVDSDADGFFQFSLPVGNYSLFVQENGSYFCANFGADGQVQPLIVTENATIKAQVDIAYLAAF